MGFRFHCKTEQLLFMRIKQYNSMNGINARKSSFSYPLVRDNKLYVSACIIYIYRGNVSIMIAFDLGILNICLPVFHLVVDSGEVSAAEVGLKYVTLLSINSYGLYSSLNSKLSKCNKYMEPYHHLCLRRTSLIPCPCS